MNIAIIGGGPAGMRAAEIAAAGNASVTLFDAKPSVGRKFLVAGTGGLNLTRAETAERLATRYSGHGMPEHLWPSLIADFDSSAFREWAHGLGIETFAASSGRVYPVGLKAARLLRRWKARLDELGVCFKMRHRWTGFATNPTPDDLQLKMISPEGHPVVFKADAVILALGGGSWPLTGSDGSWIKILEQQGVAIAPLEPANCGWEVGWPASVLEKAEGKPLKNIVARAGEQQVEGELLITRYGIEGGALYALGANLRALKNANGTAELSLDLKPGSTAKQLISRLGTLGRSPLNLLADARSRWRLSPAAFALLESRSPYATPGELVEAAKDFRLTLRGPRPLNEAISSAGGICWSQLTDGLMFRYLPGVFAAGEMIDWEAPTGGYLLQGCMVTGHRAARSALEWLRSR
jgi:uncharacterized flavoprotein (TIGR03862 family)